MANINIIVDGQERQDFTNISVIRSMEDLSGTFSFETTSTANIDFPLRVGSICQIVVDQTTVIDGFIEKLRITYSDGQHKIGVLGRDKTADVIDSTFGNVELNAKDNPVTLKQIAESILKKLGIKDIKVIDNVGVKPFAKDHISIETGTTGFALLQKYAQKRQVLVTTDGLGNIVFTRTPTKTYKTQLTLEKNAPGTILEGSFNIDYTKRFHEYICSSQGNPSTNTITIIASTPDKVADTSGKSEADKEIRSSRVFNFQADSSSQDETAKQRATWESNFRTSQSKQWTYTLQGSIAEDDNEIWEPLRLVYVIDSFAHTSRTRLLISGVTYTQNLGEGSKTILKLMPENSFSLIVNKPVKNEAAADDGTNLTILPPPKNGQQQQ